MPDTRKWIQHFLTAVGLMLFLFLIRKIGLGTLGANLSQFGPWFLLTCGIGAMGLFTQAGAWWMIQEIFFRRVALRELFRVKIISDGFNLVLPSASLGGDAMRAFIIRERVPLREGIPSVLFDKTIEFVASIFYLSSGLLLGLFLLRLPTTLIVPALASLAITSIGIALLVVVQRRGITRSLLRLSAPLPLARRWILKRESRLLEMDQSLRHLHSRSPHRAIPPLALHLLSRYISVLEVLVILSVLDAPVGFVQALFVCTIVTSANTVFFLLPGQWGVMESVHILVLQSLGYPAAIGLSLSIIRRIRKLLFVGLALALFAAIRRPAAGASPAA